jgi:hypothetical protein
MIRRVRLIQGDLEAARLVDAAVLALRAEAEGAAFGPVLGGYARATRSAPGQGGRPVWHEDPATRQANYAARSEGQRLSAFRRPRRRATDEELQAAFAQRRQQEQGWAQAAAARQPIDPFADYTPEQAAELQGLIAYVLSDGQGEYPAESAGAPPGIISIMRENARQLRGRGPAPQRRFRYQSFG